MFIVIISISGFIFTIFFLGSQITADGDCSHEIKRRLLLETKVMINLESILNSRDITLPTKVHLIKAMGLHRVGHDWATELTEVLSEPLSQDI